MDSKPAAPLAESRGGREAGACVHQCLSALDRGEDGTQLGSSGQGRTSEIHRRHKGSGGTGMFPKGVSRPWSHTCYLEGHSPCLLNE